MQAREAQPTLDEPDCYAKALRDIFDFHPVVRHLFERAELVDRRHCLSLKILGQRDFREVVRLRIPDQAIDLGVGGVTALLDEPLERAQPAAAGGDFELAALAGYNDEVLQQAVCEDVVGKLVDITLGVALADVGFRQLQLRNSNGLEHLSSPECPLAFCQGTPLPHLFFGPQDRLRVRTQEGGAWRAQRQADPQGIDRHHAWIFAALGASHAVPETKDVGTDE